MGRAVVFFHRCMQDSQDYGSDDAHMVSRVFFTLNYDGLLYENLYVEIKQPVGANIETDPLEVGVPQGYRGPFNHEAFRAAVEKYFRGLVGSRGSGIRITGGGTARMRDNLFVVPATAEFDIDPSGGGW